MRSGDCLKCRLQDLFNVIGSTPTRASLVFPSDTQALQRVKLRSPPMLIGPSFFLALATRSACDSMAACLAASAATCSAASRPLPRPARHITVQLGRHSPQGAYIKGFYTSRALWLGVFCFS